MKSTSSSIATFPIEILSSIFAYLPSCYEDPITSRTDPPAWLAVTHVCRRWRDASLSYARLWSNIITQPHAWTAESIARSRSAPISLLIKWPSLEAPLPDVLVVALSHYPRTETFALIGPHVERHLSKVPAHKAPFLKTLHIQDPSDDPTSLDNIQFLQKDMPVLNTLLLDGCTFPWSRWSSMGIFSSSLTDLTITWSTVLHRPSKAELHACLSSLPLLEGLRLSNVFDMDIGDIPTFFEIDARQETTFPLLVLPHLRELGLCGELTLPLVLFICTLRISATAKVRVIHTHTHDALHVLARSGAALSMGISRLLAVGWSGMPSNTHLLTHIRGSPLQHSGWSLTIGPLNMPPWHIDDEPDDEHIFDNIPLIHIQSPMPSPIPDVTASIIGSTVFACSFFSTLIMRMVLADWPTAIISVVSPVFTGPEMWWECFAFVNPSRGLRVEGPAALGLIDALDADVTKFERVLSAINRLSVPQEREPPRHLFPTLKRLRLVNINFRDDDDHTFERFRSALERRRDATPCIPSLENLSIVRCNVRGEQIEELKQYLESDDAMEWDGIEENEEGEEVA